MTNRFTEAKAALKLGGATRYLADAVIMEALTIAETIEENSKRGTAYDDTEAASSVPGEDSLPRPLPSLVAVLALVNKICSRLL